MAKVLVTTYTNFPKGVLDPFRKGFIEALLQAGNDVLLFKTNEFCVDYTSSNFLSAQTDEKLLTRKITEFQPDLIFSFNHSGIYDNLLRSVQCPIGIWLVDGPAYVASPDQFGSNRDRYDVFIPTRPFKADLEKDFGFQGNRVHYLPFCSDFVAEAVVKSQPISFIGTYFANDKLKNKLARFCGNRETWARIRLLFQSYSTERDMAWSERVKKYRLETIFDEHLDEAWILNNIAINNRLRLLESICDLGLTIFGTSNWLDAIDYSLDLGMAYHPKQIITRADIESLYNASQIVFNISHSQARGGLPWRVFDAMACNTVLVSNVAEELNTLFGNDIEIPVYSGPTEARKICENLLAQDERRERITKECNKVIENGHRFVHRIKEIANVFAVDLLGTGQGALTEIQQRDVAKTASELGSNNGSNNGKHVVPVIPGNGSRKVNIPIEVFNSNEGKFDQSNSVSCNIASAIGNKISAEVYLKDSAEYIRLDVGTHFSHHRYPRVIIRQVGLEQPQEYILDFEKDAIKKNEFLYNNQELICGYDSWCSFRNPFF